MPCLTSFILLTHIFLPMCKGSNTHKCYNWCSTNKSCLVQYFRHKGCNIYNLSSLHKIQMTLSYFYHTFHKILCHIHREQYHFSRNFHKNPRESMFNNIGSMHQLDCFSHIHCIGNSCHQPHKKCAEIMLSCICHRIISFYPDLNQVLKMSIDFHTIGQFQLKVQVLSYLIRKLPY